MAAAVLGPGRSGVRAVRDCSTRIHHATRPGQVDRYRVEPYVVAGDVYGQPPHAGRGGWTWYTGSAGWLYRVGLEAILGLRRDGDRSRIDPCIPREWSGFRGYLPLRIGDLPDHRRESRTTSRGVDPRSAWMATRREAMESCP